AKNNIMTQQSSLSRRRLWLMRLFAILFIPLLVLGILELGLRLGGYGYDTKFFRQIQLNGQIYQVPNETFSHRFFPAAIARTAQPIRFPVTKATNTYRIFLLGESAANGDPDTTYGVARYLRVLLQERYPGTDFEVICVALTAIDSNTILPIARECARHQGDLWLVYMGNNEMVGPFGAQTSYGLRAPSLYVIRTILAIKSTRIGQLLDALAGSLRPRSTAPKSWGGMGMFADNRLGPDDPARLRAYANFKGNLEDILRAAHQADVPVILSTVAVNLKDCAPFASIHAVELNTNQAVGWNHIYQQGVALEGAGSFAEALACYEQAAKIDPQFAELRFRMGTCALALTNEDLARHEFELARDFDALDFRADTRINSAIQEAAARHAGRGVHLLDAASALAQESPHGIPGLGLFYEHVHLNFAGNYLLALNFAEQARSLLPTAITVQDKGEWASAERCDERLAATVWDRQRIWQPIMSRVTSPPFTGQFNHATMLKVYGGKLKEAASLMKTQTPEQARQMYEQALALAPDDYELHGNFQRFLEMRGDLEQTIAEAKRCCELVPQMPGGFYYTGTLLVRAGSITEAADYFSRALALRSDYAEALDAMGVILANQQKPSEAAGWFRRAIRANPAYVEPYLNLGFLQQNQGENAAARASYQQAASLEPEGPADYFHRAYIAAARHQWDAAIANLRSVVNAKPQFWQARFQLGTLLASQGLVDEAQVQFAEVIRHRPDYAPAHYQLGMILISQGHLDQAMAKFESTVRLDPANRPALEQIESLKAKLEIGDTGK
ncbi:MAG: tetratricopeptide repeat protein, partial [Verrucomicrobia bacterium]|nr:tetratricopeptide repeat protein [Verrucomicrobiota bacterium]